MRDGGSVQGVSPAVARATNGTAEQKSNKTPHQKCSRELRGITDERHFQHHPMHDTDYTHGSTTTASRSTSAEPSTTRKTVGSTISGFGTDLQVVPEVPSGDEESAHGGDPHLGARTRGRTTVSFPPDMGGKKRKREGLTQTDSGERLTDVKTKEHAVDTSDVGNWDEERETEEARGGPCTRSKLGRTARPEITDVEGLCMECKSRARTPGARDCARCVLSSSFKTC